MLETKSDDNDRIREPHDSNDVVLDGNHKGSSSLLLVSTSTEYQGNHRFLELLQTRQEEYQSRPKLEKSIVAVELLKQWRQQVPPGRFLVVEDDDLFRDVGDKKARAHISKALKQLVSSTSNLSASDTSSVAPDIINFRSVQADHTGRAVHRPEVTPGYLQEEKKDSSSFRGQEGIGLSPSTSITSDPSSLSGMHQEEKKSESPTPLVVPPGRFKNMMRPAKNTRRISEHLQSARAGGTIYGRWDERDRLVDILRGSGDVDTKADFVLIEGPMGVGKTALAQTLKCPLAWKKEEEEEEKLGSESESEELRPSYFLEAKFEHLRSPNPYRAFIDIFHDFCQQLLKEDTIVIQQYRRAILDAFHDQDEKDMLLHWLPMLRTVLYPNARDDLSSSSTSSCCSTKKMKISCGVLLLQKTKSLFAKLLQTIAAVTPEKKLVVLFDDVHWACETALDILACLVADVTPLETNEDYGGNIVFVACLFHHRCKHNAHCDKAMERLQTSHNVQLTEFHLQNLAEYEVEDILADTFTLRHAELQRLCSLVFSLTKGNPMFIMELLRYLQDEGLVYVQESSQEWACDYAKIQQSCRDMKCVSDLFQKKIQGMSKKSQETLMQAACLGSSEILESTMALLTQDLAGSVIESHINEAAKAGLLRQQNGGYHFASDGVQCAIYTMIPEEQRAAFHMGIGQGLWHKHLEDHKGDEEFLFLLLSQLMMGDSLLKQDSDRHAVATLCLKAGEVAVKSSRFQTALVYLNYGISVLPSGKRWGRDNYDLSLRLHNATIEVCYCNAEYDRLDELIEAILEHSRVFEDSLIARSTKIYALGSRNRLSESIETGLETLKELGETFPLNPSTHRLASEFRKVQLLIRGVSDEALLKTRAMSDRKKLAVMQVVNHLLLYCLYSRPTLAALLSLRMVEITLEFGLCAISSTAFCYYAMFLCSRSLVEDGQRLGKLALKVYGKFKSEAWLCRTWSMYYGMVAEWDMPMSEIIAPLEKAYRIGIRTGDVEYAMLNGMMTCWMYFDTLPLPRLLNKAREVAQAMELSGHTMARAMLQPVLDFATNLTTGPSEGGDNRKAEFLAKIGRDSETAIESQNEAALLWLRLTTAYTAFIFSDYELAEKYVAGVDGLYDKHAYCGLGGAYVMFVECIILLARCRQCSFLERRRRLAYVRSRLKRVAELAYLSPENLLDTHHHLLAEYAAARGDNKKASMNFRAAILHAKDKRNFFTGALANERFALRLIEQGRHSAATPFLKEACRVYGEWGGVAKVAKLRHAHPSVFGGTDKT